MTITILNLLLIILGIVLLGLLFKGALDRTDDKWKKVIKADKEKLFKEDRE